MPSRSALVLPFFVAACSSPEPSQSTPATDSGVADTITTTDTGTDTRVTKVPCSEPPEDRPAGSQCVKTVRGKVADPTGAAIPAGKLISVCGSICFYGETKADGTFTAAVGSYIKVTNFAVSVHGRPDHGSLYVKLSSTTAEDIELPDTMFVPAVPAMGTKIAMDKDRIVTSAINVTHGDVTLGFEAKTTVDLDLEDIELLDKGGDHLRAVKVEEKDYPPFAKGANVKLLYNLTPFDARFDKKVSVTINGTGGLADGTAVELIALGNDFLREPFTAGTLQVVATGKVSGGKVVTDAGQGLSYVTWIGVRAK